MNIIFRNRIIIIIIISYPFNIDGLKYDDIVLYDSEQHTIRTNEINLINTTLINT